MHFFCTTKSLFFLDSVIEINFWEQTCVLLSYCCLVFFGGVYLPIFCIFVGFLFPTMLGNNSLLLRFGF